MAEQLDLTVPITRVTRTSYQIARIVLDWEAGVVQVVVRGSDDTEVSAEWTGTAAVALMTLLNTMNLSVTSLHKRVLQRLVADGKLPGGVVSGTAS